MYRKYKYNKVNDDMQEDENQKFQLCTRQETTDLTCDTFSPDITRIKKHFKVTCLLQQ